MLGSSGHGFTRINTDFLRRMEAIWLVLTEIVAQTGDPPRASEVGFMNVTTWAESKEAAGTKIRRYLESFGWNLVLIEGASVVEDKGSYGDDVAEMIERTRGNPKAIILGTFHTYRTN
jgi:hypothetical protein